MAGSTDAIAHSTAGTTQPRECPVTNTPAWRV